MNHGINVRLTLSPAALRAWLTGLILVFCTAELGSENVTLSTYYPAPSGVYARMITTDNTYLATMAAANVGIGTTSPGYKLVVKGDASMGDSYDPAKYGVVQIARPANQGDTKFHLSYIRVGNQVVGSGFLNNSNIFAVAQAANTSDSRILSFNSGNGNVGIATTAPGQTLDVSGGIAVQGWDNQFYAKDTAGSGGYRHVIGGAHGWDPNMLYVNGWSNFSSGVSIGGGGGSSNLLVTGNAGIGVTAPATRLDVAGNALISGNVEAVSLTAMSDMQLQGQPVINSVFCDGASNLKCDVTGHTIRICSSAGCTYNCCGCVAIGPAWAYGNPICAPAWIAEAITGIGGGSNTSCTPGTQITWTVCYGPWAMCGCGSCTCTCN